MYFFLFGKMFVFLFCFLVKSTRAACFSEVLSGVELINSFRLCWCLKIFQSPSSTHSYIPATFNISNGCGCRLAVSESGTGSASVASSVCDENKQPRPFRIKYSSATPVL